MSTVKTEKTGPIGRYLHLISSSYPLQSSLYSSRNVQTLSSKNLDIIRFEGKSFDTKADVYSFGIVLWELAFPKKVPYDGKYKGLEGFYF